MPRWAEEGVLKETAIVYFVVVGIVTVLDSDCVALADQQFQERVGPAKTQISLHGLA